MNKTRLLKKLITKRKWIYSLIKKIY